MPAGHRSKYIARHFVLQRSRRTSSRLRENCHQLTWRRYRIKGYIGDFRTTLDQRPQ